MKDSVCTINTFTINDTVKIIDTVKNTNWIVDSGVINNMVHNEKLLNKVDNNNIKEEQRCI